MDVEAVLVRHFERQACEHGAMGWPKLLRRPVDGGAGHGTQRHAGVVGGEVMIAEHGDGAVLDELCHALDDPDGIGSVTDEIAEKHQALRPLLAGVGQTGGQRLPVRMNVGKECDQHG
jgi:hypothetical protein